MIRYLIFCSSTAFCICQVPICTVSNDDGPTEFNEISSLANFSSPCTSCARHVPLDQPATAQRLLAERKVAWNGQKLITVVLSKVVRATGGRVKRLGESNVF